jgi:pilus assembly protein FimV
VLVDPAEYKVASTPAPIAAAAPASPPSTPTPAAQPDAAAVAAPAPANAPAPSITAAAPAAVTTTPAPGAATLTPAPAASAPVAAAPAPTPAPTANALIRDSYRIKRGDTLGGIARRWKHDGVTMQQMMIGFYQTNPEAFIRENINLIRAGSTLLVPAREEVLAISEEDAAHRIRLQMADFNKYRRAYAAGAGGSSQSVQASRDTISRRIAGRKATRSM